MKRLVEALLLIASIGGGFMGFCIALAEVLKLPSVSAMYFIVFGIALGLYGFFVVAGLVFAANKATLLPLKIAFLLQIPWLSSPILAYQISAGFSVSGIVHTGGFHYSLNLGSNFNFGLLNGQPWGIGLNLAAAVLYFIALRYSTTVIASGPSEGSNSL